MIMWKFPEALKCDSHADAVSILVNPDHVVSVERYQEKDQVYEGFPNFITLITGDSYWVSDEVLKNYRSVPNLEDICADVEEDAER